MGRQQDTEYKDILHKSFKPAYLFSKLFGVMPLSYKRRRTLSFWEASKRNTNAIEFVWSWQSAIYSGLWIALHVTLRYWIFHTRRFPPPPKVKENGDRGDLSSGNISETSNPPNPPDLPTERELWIGSVNERLDFACTIFALVLGVLATRKLPQIFRQFQHLDETAEEEGYMLLGEFGFRRLVLSTRICIFL
jgi:hypothetical protein